MPAHYHWLHVVVYLACLLFPIKFSSVCITEATEIKGTARGVCALRQLPKLIMVYEYACHGVWLIHHGMHTHTP